MKTANLEITRELLDTVQGGSALKLIGTGMAIGAAIVTPFVVGDTAPMQKGEVAAMGLGWGAVAGWTVHGIRRFRAGR